MTGQAIPKIEAIREAALTGATSKEISAKLGLSYHYVRQLAKLHAIPITKQNQNRASELRALAKKGLTRKQAAKRLNLSYTAIHGYSARYDIKFAREYCLPLDVRIAQAKRALDFATLYQSGYTLEQIGKKFKVTRERVRQVLSKDFGITGNDGGQHTRAIENQKKTAVRRDKHSQKKWGCSWADYIMLREMRHPTLRFAAQRQNAKKRGIGWELSLWQWWKIWEQSGLWAQRGSSKNSYCMCRLNDTGPYAIDNVYIATQSENIKDYWVRARETGMRRPSKPVDLEQRRLKVRLYYYRRKFRKAGMAPELIAVEAERFARAA